MGVCAREPPTRQSGCRVYAAASRVPSFACSCCCCLGAGLRVPAGAKGVACTHRCRLWSAAPSRPLCTPHSCAAWLCHMPAWVGGWATKQRDSSRSNSSLSPRTDWQQHMLGPAAVSSELLSVLQASMLIATNKRASLQRANGGDMQETPAAEQMGGRLLIPFGVAPAAPHLEVQLLHVAVGNVDDQLLVRHFGWLRLLGARREGTGWRTSSRGSQQRKRDRNCRS